MSQISLLRDYLEKQPVGSISDPAEVKRLLCDCWNEFKNSEQTQMDASKLSRIEAPTWHPPHLSFSIERHGGTVMGSARASIQGWSLNLNTLTAAFGHVSHRQLKPMSPRLNLEPIAQELAECIVAEAIDPRLRWLRNGSVQINMQTVIPFTNRQTTAGRRKRLSKRLVEILAPQGWSSPYGNVYTKEPDDKTTPVNADR
jgi:hypothetical protein